MRIEVVRAHAFGPFRDRTLELAPGMNVLYGPNEAGKSSWHAALYAGICGVRRGPGITKEAREFTDRHRPWDDPERWEVSTVVSLSDGRRLELRHDLAGRVDSSIVDLDTAEDLSGRYMFDGAPDGAGLIGLNRKCLPATLFVRQADLLRVLEDADELQIYLQRAAATGGADETAESAIRRLEQFWSEQVGRDDARSTRPLRHARIALRDAATARDLARDAHADYLDLLRRAEQAEVEADAAERRLAAARARAAEAELVALERRLERARELAAELPDGVAGPVEDEQETVRQVTEALSSYANRPAEPVALDGESAEEIAEELAALPAAPSGGTEPEDVVEEAAAALRDARRDLARHLESAPDAPASTETPDLVPAELREAAEALETPIPEVDEELRAELDAVRSAGRPSVVVLALSAALAVAALVLFAVGLPAAGAAALVAAAAVVIIGVVTGRGGGSARQTQLEARLAVQEERSDAARQRRDSAADRVAQWGLTADPAELRRLAVEIEQSQSGAGRLAEWTREKSALEGAAEEAEDRLRPMLRAREVEGADDDDVDALDLVRRYREECAERSRQAREAARRPDLQARLEARRAAEQAAEEDREAHRAADAGLRAAAVRAGIDSDEDGDPDELVVALREWRAGAERRATLRESAAALQELLDGRTIDDLADEVDRRRAAATPPSDGDAGSAVPSEEEIAELEHAAVQAQRDAANLRGQVGERERELPSVAEADEAVEQAEVELDRVRRLDETLTRTKEFLERARDEVQRDIAPRLRDAVAERLSAVTDGRYDEVKVDPRSLAVGVRASGGPWRDAAHLSHGTTEQIYLLLRVAMSEQIVTTGEPAPLILDDVTVQSDASRTRALLDLLHELSRERQIVVFSQEEDVRAWAEAHVKEPQDVLVHLDGTDVSA
jgi:DNA repair protein SbcC/Rad50